MKFSFPLVTFILLAGISNAQVVTDSVLIEGDVIKPVKISGSMIKSYPVVSLDSMRVYGHDMQPRGLMKNIKGVLLRDILSSVQFNAESTKQLSAYVIECVASDGYTVLFSWNEIFNSETGLHTMIITEKNGSDFTKQDDRIALITPTDKATGHRYVKSLSRIIILRIK